MSSAVIGKPPPGLDLSEERIVQNDGIVAAVMAIATVFVGLRFWARTANRSASLEYDDWSLLVALVCDSIPKSETYSADGVVQAFAYGTGVCCILGTIQTTPLDNRSNKL